MIQRKPCLAGRRNASLCIDAALRRPVRTAANPRHRAIPLLIALALLQLQSAYAADPLDIGLEELLAAEVTGASRKSQQLRDVAAAVFVLSREDIARSGATSIPDVLRLVPGVQVAQLGNGRWAISARGFSGRFANKLQVLMDGRSLYSPLFAGVLWETEDTLLDDIERIEVIRGPGAAMWGANAVNGVINIVTRKARDTQGNVVSAIAGTDRSELSVRHGAPSGDGHYRLWAKALANPDSPAFGGGDANDDRRAARMGYRGDWLSDSGKQLSVIGGAYANAMGDRYLVADLASPVGVTPTDKRQRNRGAHLLARQQMALSGGSRVSIQAYVDTSRMQITDFIDEKRTTADVEFEHHLRVGERHNLVWGLEQRHSRDQVEGVGILSITPDHKTTRLSSLFVHDDISIVADRLNLALGVRLDHGESTGLETQPSIRAVWKPSSTQSVWASAARASRLPSRAENDISIDLLVVPGTPATLFRNVPPPDGTLKSEVVDAIEAGYRAVWHDTASIDISVFRNRYHNLRGAITGPTDLSGLPTVVVQTVVPANAVEARSHGVELSGDVQVASWWHLYPAWTWLKTTAWAPSGDPSAVSDAQRHEVETPRQRFSLRSSMNLGKTQQLDVVVRQVGRSATTAGSAVDRYTTLDVRYALRPTDRTEFALVGRNLGRKQHVESTSDLLPAQATEVARSAFVTAKWEF
jgi:iron complex outermembrane receptor protein